MEQYQVASPLKLFGVTCGREDHCTGGSANASCRDSREFFTILEDTPAVLVEVSSSDDILIES